jgi:hypothetical protein
MRGKNVLKGNQSYQVEYSVDLLVTFMSSLTFEDFPDIFSNRLMATYPVIRQINLTGHVQ